MLDKNDKGLERLERLLRTREGRELLVEESHWCEDDRKNLKEILQKSVHASAPLLLTWIEADSGKIKYDNKRKMWLRKTKDGYVDEICRHDEKQETE